MGRYWRTLLSDFHMLAWTLAMGYLRRSHSSGWRKEQVEMEHSDELTQRNFPPKGMEQPIFRFAGFDGNHSRSYPRFP